MEWVQNKLATVGTYFATRIYEYGDVLKTHYIVLHILFNDSLFYESHNRLLEFLIADVTVLRSALMFMYCDFCFEGVLVLFLTRLGKYMCGFQDISQCCLGRI